MYPLSIITFIHNTFKVLDMNNPDTAWLNTIYSNSRMRDAWNWQRKMKNSEMAL